LSSKELIVDEIIKEVAEVFDLPPARAKVIVEMVASRLQASSARSGSSRQDDDHDSDHRKDEHRSDDHDRDGGHGTGKPAKKGGLRGLLGDVGGMLGGE
jgi:hypothetical protein